MKKARIAGFFLSGATNRRITHQLFAGHAHNDLIVDRAYTSHAFGNRTGLLEMCNRFDFAFQADGSLARVDIDAQAADLRVSQQGCLYLCRDSGVIDNLPSRPLAGFGRGTLVHSCATSHESGGQKQSKQFGMFHEILIFNVSPCDAERTTRRDCFGRKVERYGWYVSIVWLLFYCQAFTVGRTGCLESDCCRLSVATKKPVSTSIYEATTSSNLPDQ
ncbi:MAG TPA: hypothetical protein VGU61_10125 [Noviherbaspirillum sp.]|jgi:hypothetical protein|nr:hypothetical protein [Noviherbaspirillum sp.]HEV2610611.1 hypothetical protein [Noviherbaspirillum sp.]